MLPMADYDESRRLESVDEATAVIAQVIGQDQINLDIVDNGRVVEGSELVGDIQRPLQLVVHNSNRQVSVIHQTLSPDIVNDWEEGPRVEMSCGHAITPDNLYGYCWSQLTKQRSSFRCFADVNGRNCDKEWLFVEVAEKACLSHDEHFLFESRINRNWINNSEGVRECPSCRLVCERQDPTNAYVNCLHCKSAGKGEFRFCWYCLDGWTVKHQCKKSSVHQMLSHCERKEIADISGCPSIRACPECNTLIEHTEGCKHMTCVDCCCTFCFVCLGFRGNTGFACGSYDSKCDVAPIQTVT
ncbi:E3 ubiquitin-protein ligase ARIH2 [Mizuhopecten yessoensis]|uniref:E3 ubiquitin-protein ligase ARIH2 n=1 Tax=Mizuhopecten yessoensis TaxID=6573 RepID=A0A210QMK6_MIZYE|nr:E3 ubiquitin-protein ligase ARIH2 [Mizuhopecten yessoensis]